MVSKEVIYVMTVILQILLIIISISTLLFMFFKIRKAQIVIEDSLFWVIFSFWLIIFSVFPQSADYLSKLIGVESTVNFLFLSIIFIILIKLFNMTIKISKLETKIKTLTQKIAIEKNINERNTKK